MSDKYTVKQQQQADEQELEIAKEQLRRESAERKRLEEALDVSPRILMRAEQIAGDEVRIEVQDNGTGVETKDGKDVFKMFARS